MAQPTDDQLSDLIDLSEILDSLLAAAARYDMDAVEAHYRDAVHLCNAVATLHGGIVQQAIKDYRDFYRKAGYREIHVPRGFVGSWYVYPEKAKL